MVENEKYDSDIIIASLQLFVIVEHIKARIYLYS